MKLVVNRKEMDVEEEITLRKLLETLNLGDRMLGAAVNGMVISVCSIDGHTLKEGDKVDILPALAAG
jgi:thiamine biosynthesis protein ThiS